MRPQALKSLWGTGTGKVCLSPRGDVTACGGAEQWGCPPPEVNPHLQVTGRKAASPYLSTVKIMQVG